MKVTEPHGKTLKSDLIDQERIQEFGGVESPEVRGILDSFTTDLVAYMHLIDQQREEECGKELSGTLHKLAGASRTCGFVGISRAVDAWTDADLLFNLKLHRELQAVIEASIAEWRSMVS
jgi:HPt (histidine-containing phosphotransfer) domain-containing protein